MTDAHPRRRQWTGALLLPALLLPTLLLTADLGVLWLATPPLAADLAPSGSQLLWINDIYGFAMACLLVLAGNAGDRFGRRRVLLSGVAVFALASLVAAYAPNPPVLIAARALLGVAGAAIIPSTLALISHLFTDARQRARAIALWVTALFTGIALGPVLSGVLLQHFWWGSVFLVGVPVMVAVLVVTPFAVPESADPGAVRLDRLSVPLLLLTLLPFVYAIKHVGEYGPGPRALLATALAAGFGALFVRRQRRIAEPLLDLRLFADRTFTAALLLLFTGLAAMNGVEYLVPQYLQIVSGLPALEAGLLMVLPAVGPAVGSQLTPVLARRVRPARVIAGGAVLALAGFALLAALPADGSGAARAAVGTCVMMAGLAPVTVLGTGIAVGAAPPQKAGQAAAVGQTGYELGPAFGVAATGSVMAAVYRGRVSAAAPDGVPQDAVDRAAENTGGGIAAAEHLPHPLGDALASVVREGFAFGLHAAAVVSGSLTVLLLMLALVLLRRVPPTGTARQDAGRDDTETADGARELAKSDRAPASGSLG